MAKANPDPHRISAEMWKFWLWCKTTYPQVELGGIYADKRGYHNAAENLPRTDYSRRRPADWGGDKTKSAAIDLTFRSTKDMARFSKRLLAAGRSGNREMRVYVREFFGTLDGKTVCGWDYAKGAPSSSNKTHLWHIHISVRRKHLNNPKAFAILRKILMGTDKPVKKVAPKPVAKPAPKPVKAPAKAPVKAPAKPPTKAPAKPVVKPKVAPAKYVLVLKGDTLTKIATRNKTTLAKLLSLNPHKKANPNALRVGEKVRVQ